MMTPRQFFENQAMVGHLATELRPQHLDALDGIFSPVSPVLATINGAPATGKTLLLVASTLRLVYEFLQFPTSPHYALGLPDNTPVHVLVSASVMDCMRPLLEEIPFFRSKCSTRGTRNQCRIRFPLGLSAMVMNDGSSGIGLNIIGMALDDVDLNLDMTWLGSHVMRVRARMRQTPDLIQAIGSLAGHEHGYEPVRPTLRSLVAGNQCGIERVRERMSGSYEVNLR